MWCPDSNVTVKKCSRTDQHPMHFWNSDAPERQNAAVYDLVDGEPMYAGVAYTLGPRHVCMGRQRRKPRPLSSPALVVTE